MTTIFRLGLLAIICSALGGCSPSDEPIAHVGNASISLQTFKNNYQALLAVPGFKQDPKTLLDRQIERTLLTQEAVQRGYLNSPEIQEQIKSILIRKLTEEEAAKASDPAQWTEGQIAQYYQANLAEFDRPQRIKAQYVRIPFSNNPAKARQSAQRALLSILHSKAATTTQAFTDAQKAFLTQNAPQWTGTTEFLTKEEAVQLFGQEPADTLWRLSDAQPISEPSQGADAFYLFFRFRETPAHVSTLSEAQGLIRRRLSLEKKADTYTQLVKTLKSKYPVKVFEDKLATVAIDHAHEKR